MINLGIDVLRSGIVNGRLASIAKCKVDSSWTVNSIFGGEFASPVEFFYPNQLYGHSTIIRLFYGLESLPMPFVIPHMVRDYSDCWSMEIESGLPILCYSDYSYLTYLKTIHFLGKSTRLYKSRHPLRLLKKILEKQNDKWAACQEKSSRILFFPDHSTGRIDGKLYDLNYDKAIVAQLKQKYKEVNICFYYIDLIRLIDKGLFKDLEGIYDNVYCCGDRYSPDFLLKLAALLLHHGSIAYSAFGSISYLSTMFQNNQVILFEKLNDSYIESNLRKMGSDGKYWLEFDKKLVRDRVDRHHLNDIKSNVNIPSNSPQLTRYINIPDSECQLSKVIKEFVIEKSDFSQINFNKIYPMISCDY